MCVKGSQCPITSVLLVSDSELELNIERGNFTFKNWKKLPFSETKNESQSLIYSSDTKELPVTEFNVSFEVESGCLDNPISKTGARAEEECP